MNVVLAKTETGRALSDSFAVARDRLPGAGKLAESRRQAFEAYERAGLPHRRIEAWHYTDLRTLVRDPRDLRLTWKHGLGEGLQQDSCRLVELRNWLELQVLPYSRQRH